MANRLNNVTGLIFTKKAETFLGVTAWLEAGAPDNVSVYDTPCNLLTVNITICDGRKTDGAYYRSPSVKPKPFKLATRYFTNRKVLMAHELPLTSFPRFILYDESKFLPKSIGTNIKVW